MIWRAECETRNFSLEAYGHTKEEALRAMARMWDDWRAHTGATLTTQEIIDDCSTYMVGPGLAYMDKEEYR